MKIKRKNLKKIYLITFIVVTIISIIIFSLGPSSNPANISPHENQINISNTQSNQTNNSQNQLNNAIVGLMTPFLYIMMGIFAFITIYNIWNAIKG